MPKYHGFKRFVLHSHLNESGVALRIAGPPDNSFNRFKVR